MSPARLSRRGLGRLGLAAAAAAAVTRIRPARAAGELRVLAPEGYAEDPWVSRFATQTGATISVKHAASGEEAAARLEASAGDFDVVALDSGAFRTAIEREWIQPIALSRLSNWRNLQRGFRDIGAVVADGEAFGIPFAWGVRLPLIYDEAAFPDGPPDSWSALWDAQYAQQIVLVDDANANIVNAAILLGYEDPSNLASDQLDLIRAKLVEQKRLLLTYCAGAEDGVRIFARAGVKLMVCGGEAQVAALRGQGVRAAMSVPKEGAAGWLDCWAIASGARDPDLAHRWLNITLRREVGAAISDRRGYGNTTDTKANEKAGRTYAERLVYLQAPEDLQRRTELWIEVKAASI